MIRAATASDLDTILALHRAAFKQDDEAALTASLIGDPSAAPVLSLLHDTNGTSDAHVLFTHVSLSPPHADTTAQILCPLAVHHEAQRQGVGTALVNSGLAQLRNAGCDLVFVLGDPSYYGRFGFSAVGSEGPAAPFPLPEHYAPGWQVMALSQTPVPSDAAPVTCAKALMHPHYWAD